MNTIKTTSILVLLIFVSINFIAESAETTIITDSNSIKMQHIISNTDTTNLASDTLQLDTNNIVKTKNELTFWDKYIVPVVAVLGAATITLLLFGMRSKQ